MACCGSLSYLATVSGAIGRSGLRYLEKISRASSSVSGRATLILISRRPGLRTAGSSKSCRLLAPITITSRSPSIPSISAKKVGTTVNSISDEMPIPRDRNRESISSKKMTTGTPSLDLSRAFWKTSRIFRSVSPTYLLSNSGPLTLIK